MASDRRFLLWAAGIALLVGAFLTACSRPTPTERPTPLPVESPTPLPTEGVLVETPAQVRRELDVVWAGVDGPDPTTLPRLEDSEWHDLPDGGWVTTDEEGEGWVRINDCMLIYVFQDSRLLKSACPKSDYLGGNVTCATQGSSVYNNQCASQIIIQTPSAQLVLEGTWLSVTYLPDRQLTLVMVFEGQVEAQPVLDLDTYALGEAVVVPEGHFWFTTPGLTPGELSGLAARTAHPFDRLLPVVEELDLWRWIERITARADMDNIPYPRIPPFVPGPGPTPSTVTPTLCGPPANWVIYVVQANDTLFSLAAETGTSVERLKQANCLVDDTLLVGQSVYLPFLPPTRTPIPPGIPVPPATATPIPTPTPTPTFTPVPPPADLRIEVTESIDPVWADEAYRYMVTVSNDGPAAAQNVSVITSLPAGVMEKGVSTVGCANDPAGVPSCQLGSIAAGVSKSFVINVTAPDTLETVTNTASVSSTTRDPDPGDNVTSVDTGINPLANLRIEKRDSVDPVAPDEAYSYLVTVFNDGPSDAQDVTVSETLPAGADLESTVGCDNDPAGVPTCALGTIAAGASKTFTINVRAPDTLEAITNTASVSATTRDPDPDDNAVSEETGIIPPADLRIEKRDSIDPVAPDEAYSYLVTVFNDGPSDAQGVRVSDILPAGVGFVSTVGCDNDPTGVPTCALGTIMVDASKAFTINVTAPDASGAVTNTASVSSSTRDPDPGDNVISEDTGVILLAGGELQADLEISKDNGTTRTAPGARTTYTIVVTNNGPRPVTSATVIDNFPAELGNVKWTCVASGGARCTAGDTGNINDQVDIPVGASLTYTVDADVREDATGALVNVATVIAPTHFVDPNPDNNSHTDRDRLTRRPFQTTGAPAVNTGLWIVQILLAGLYLLAGVLKLVPVPLEVTQYMREPSPRLRILRRLGAAGWERTSLIASLEILGAVGLILPALTRILTWLTPVAAVGLGVLNVGEVIVQARRGEEVVPGMMVLNVVSLAMAVLVALGRFLLAPL